MAKVMPLVEVLPLFGTLYHVVEVLDRRDPTSWRATGPQQVLMRNATSTRHGYEGEGLMKKLAQFLMREAKLEGYRSIQIECVNDTVTHTWCHPPHPFKGELIAEVDMETYEEEAEDGKRVRVFAPAKQRGTKVFVTL
ncbi:hypothetical protein LTR60_001098 [Cryomyces antarcticus]|nr:hypothetical protein LTR60_001098 [Cryomyces antarcticus]